MSISSIEESFNDQGNTLAVNQLDEESENEQVIEELSITSLEKQKTIILKCTRKIA